MTGRKLDVGCGTLDESKRARYRRSGRSPDEYIGVDHARIPGVSVVADLDRSLPFADESVDEIVAVHLLEHVRDLEHTMREFHRILKPGCALRAWVPHCFSAIAFGDDRILETTINKNQLLGQRFLKLDPHGDNAACVVIEPGGGK